MSQIGVNDVKKSEPRRNRFTSAQVIEEKALPSAVTNGAGNDAVSLRKMVRATEAKPLEALAKQIPAKFAKK